MKYVFLEIIFPHQSAFVKGRHISDNILIAHEVIRFLKNDKSNNHHIAIKIDMNKAYDQVKWETVIFMMDKIGFNQ